MEQKTSFRPGRAEAVLGIACLILGLALGSSLYYGGFNLGFALSALGFLGAGWLYLGKSGKRFDGYTGSLMALSMAVSAGFARTDDGSLKFLALWLLGGAVCMGMCQSAGRNLRDPRSLGSLLDGPRALFRFGFGSLAGSLGGLAEAGGSGKRVGAAALGVALAAPVVLVVGFLLMRADAAFEAVMDLLPEFGGLEEWTVWGSCGLFAGWLFYSLCLGLCRREGEPAPVPKGRGLSPITWNIVLGSVAVMYLAYLVSQLAYLGGGFVGLLPEDATLSAYARRGFFEMALLVAVNLGLILAASVRGRGKPGTVTRGLCLTLGGVSLFFVAAAAAKMLLYIQGYGLTRMRLLTQVFMAWLAVVTVLVCLWLFRPKVSWMKGGMVLALALCAGLLWADVDAQVARYNVNAYQRGSLETVDMAHLSTLSHGAVPYIAALCQDEDPLVASTARDILTHCRRPLSDLRGWNAASARAEAYLSEHSRESAPAAEEIVP